MEEPLKKVIYDSMLLHIIKGYAPKLYEKALDSAMVGLSEDGFGLEETYEAYSTLFLADLGNKNSTEP